MLVSLFCKPILEKEKQRCRLPLLASWPLTTLFLVFGRCKGRLVYKINQKYFAKKPLFTLNHAQIPYF